MGVSSPWGALLPPILQCCETPASSCSQDLAKGVGGPHGCLLATEVVSMLCVSQGF